MAEVSEAEKTEMIAAANARQEGGPAPTTQKIGPDMDPAPIMSEATAPAVVTPASGGGVDGDPGEWGPYRGYEIVNTGFGEYGVEKGKVLFFELAQQFQAKVGAFTTVRLPRYRDPDQTREDALVEYNASELARPLRG